MTDPLSPEEIDGLREGEFGALDTITIERLISIAIDHARLHEARDDNGQWAIEVRRQLMRVGQIQAPFIDDAVRDLVDEVLTAREQNAKLRERVEKLEDSK